MRTDERLWDERLWDEMMRSSFFGRPAVASITPELWIQRYGTKELVAVRTVEAPIGPGYIPGKLVAKKHRSCNRGGVSRHNEG